MKGIRRARAALGVALVLLTAGTAQALLIGTDVTVELLSPGDSLAASDVVTVGGGPEITPADGSEIGAILLSTEVIDIGANTIVVGLEAGGSGGTTGYAAGASYVFSNLYATVGMAIDTVSLALDNITGLTLGDIDVLADSNGVPGRIVSIPIDTLVIGDVSGIDTGTVTLTFTTVIPEPGTALLLGGGLAALAASRRRGTAWR